MLLFSCTLFNPPSLPPSSGTALTPTHNFPSFLCPHYTSHHTTSPYPAPPPTAHLPPRGHRATWAFPGSRYLASILSGSLVSPLVSSFYAVVVSPCIAHLARLAPLDRPSQPLIHAPLNAPIFLHYGVNTNDSACQWYRTTCGTI